MSETLIVILSGACGVAIKTAWNAWIDKKKVIELETWKIRISELEKRLSQFYWPIYLRLQRDNVVWTTILDRQNHLDVERQQLAYHIEQGVLLPNHAEIVKIIESNIHLAVLDAKFEKAVLRYLRHVDIYRSLRTVGIKDKDPAFFGERYPKQFFCEIEQRLLKFQAEYEKALRIQGIN